jgi:hypothetical protein
MSFLRDVKQKYGPFDEVIQTGDLVDFLAFSQFDRSPDADSCTQEIDQARIQIQALGKIFPKMVTLYGNHMTRIFKRVEESGVPAKFLRKMEDILGFPPGWKLVKKYESNGVLYVHGEEVSGRAAATSLIQLYRKNVVCGHLHGQSTIQYLSNGQSTSFAMVTGCLVNEKALAFAYGTRSKDKPVKGLAIIEDGVPRWIPFYVPKSRK